MMNLEENRRIDNSLFCYLVIVCLVLVYWSIEVLVLLVRQLADWSIGMKPDDLREEIELQVVELLKEKLASGEIRDSRAEQLAAHVLATLVPGMSFEDLYKAIGKLDDGASELSVIVLPHMRDYEKNVTQLALTHVRDLIREGQYDAAATLGAKAAKNDVKLEWQGQAKSG